MKIDRSYQRLSVDAFAQQLLESGDIDPIYPMLYNADLDNETLSAWLLAYWCFYDATTATELAAGARNFYAAAFGSYKRFKRGHERRHFRGSAGLKALKVLQKLGMPFEILQHLKSATFSDIKSKLTSFYLFGPWITWKIADMMECLGICELSFQGLQLSMYDEPRKGAALILHGDQNAEISETELALLVGEFKTRFQRRAAPRYTRDIGIQEIETIFCKYKAHVNGFYPLNYDTISIRESLSQLNTPLAEALLKQLPQIKHHGQFI